MRRSPSTSGLIGLFLGVLLGFTAASSEAVVLQAPRMVLNRSLFLEWDKASAAGFSSYQVHASTQQGFSPSPANRVATLSHVDLHYVRLQGLAAATRYYFRVETVTTGSTDTSGEVTAMTLADGVGEDWIPTVMYHHCQPRAQFPAGFDPGGWISSENFSRDMAYLKAHGVNAVGITEILNRLNSGIPLPPNPVFLTFDDGYVTYLQNAVPILMANDFQSANAIVTRKTGGSSDWAVPEWPLMTLMTWTQVRDCQRQGMWMGSHTQTHVDLDLEPKKAYEIAGSRDDLINQLQVHPRYFCYPWGMGGHRIQAMLDQVSAAGYTLATRTWPPAVASINSERVWFPRVFANQNDTLRDFLVKLQLETDKDGIRNHIEMDWGLDASKADTDGDGLSDGFEVAYDGNANTYNPYHPVSNTSGGDLAATRTDTDLDGLSDFDEIRVHGTNPLRADTDGDGLSDSDDVLRADPLKPDTDGDGIPDGVEVQRGLDPRVRDGRSAFGNAPVPVPGCVEAEHFDYGGAGVAYADTTAANEGGAYRPFEQVDLTVDNSASNRTSLGWTRAGEWLTYSVSVATGGYFKIAVRLAAQGSGGVFHLEIDDTNVSGPISVPNSGGWSTWRVVESPSFRMEAGVRVIKLAMDVVGSSANVAAFDRLCVLALPPPGPYGGVLRTLPGTVQMEDFDEGGAGYAYSDTTPANEGGQYRLSEGVDISRDTAAGNSHAVGWTKAGEWLEYTVNIVTSATYTLETRVAGVGAGGQFRISVNGVDKTGLLAVPNTGSWNAYQVVQKTGVALSSGIQTVRVAMVTAGASGNVGAFDWFRVTETAAAPPPPARSPYPAGSPWTLPGTVEIENFDIGGQGVTYGDSTPVNAGGQYRLADGVDISRDTGAGNSHVVGWTPAGEWLEYTVNVGTPGTYTLETRVAAVGAGGQFRISVNGTDKTGLLAVPNTGAWNAYQVVQKTGVALSSGIQTVRVAMVTAGASGNVGAFDWFRVTEPAAPPPPSARSPYPAGSPWALPGTVEIENFDIGEAGLTYSDTTPANEGGQYRLSEGVDIARDTAAGNSHVVGWTKAGEWLEYTVNIVTSATYTLETRVAAVGAGGQFRISVNGVDKTGLLAVPNTGAWNAYQVVQKTGVALSSGIQTVRVAMVTAGASGHVGAFDWFRVTEPAAPPPPPARSPYPAGSPWALPGTVEIENFDIGGQGVTYSDSTPVNAGGQYRLADGVDISRDTGAGNSHVVGWTPAGEWLEYTVTVGTPGSYTLETRVAAVGAGGQFRISVNGTDKTGLLAVPNTGAWNAYQVVQKTGVALSSGIQTVRVAMVTAGSSGNVGAFDWFRVTETAAPPPPPARSPYPAGSPWTLPGTVEIENFDIGGQGVTYGDSTPANAGGQYRLADGVDISRDTGAGNSHVVGWTPAGEWLEYTVNVSTPGTYTLETRVAAMGSGGRFRILVNGEDKTGLLVVPSTGAWNAYQIVQKTGVTLSSGIQTVRVDLVTAGASGNVGAFDWFRIAAATPPSRGPYGGTRWTIPGYFAARDFDVGGEGVAYHDNTSNNTGGQYRPNEGVDIAALPIPAMPGPVVAVGWTEPGEWMEYSVTVASSGNYVASVAGASAGPGGTFQLQCDGANIGGTMRFPDTGGWNTYGFSTQSQTFSLTAGNHIIRLTMLTAGQSGHVAAFHMVTINSQVSAATTEIDRTDSIPVDISFKPLAVRTSQEDQQPGAGWLAVDGDIKTAWRGLPEAGGWWMVLTYDPQIAVNGLTLDWAPDSPTNVQYLYSLDAKTWFDLVFPLTNGPVDLNYLWLVFPHSDSNPPPAIREIHVK